MIVFRENIADCQLHGTVVLARARVQHALIRVVLPKPHLWG